MTNQKRSLAQVSQLELRLADKTKPPDGIEFKSAGRYVRVNREWLIDVSTKTDAAGAPVRIVADNFVIKERLNRPVGLN
jgi:hypothetical protein